MAEYDKVDDFISGNELAQQGKYFLIHVPNYNDAKNVDDFDDNGIPKGTSKRNSYLRLGAAAAKWTEEPGADLVRLAYLVGPAGKKQDPTVVKRFTDPSSPEYDPYLAKVVVVDDRFIDPQSPDYDPALASINEKATKARELDEAAAASAHQPAPEWPTLVFAPPFIDDQRSRGTGNDKPHGSNGHGLTLDERRAVSAELHTRGGWRDHSDGNRITTTRGDKIEVIQGNYKLIVMGRQTDTGQGMGWEATGNNVQDYAGATMPGASVTVEWVNHRYGGVWLLQNSTENVYQYSRNAGNFREQNWGDLWETYVGSENPPEGGIGKKDDDGLQGHPSYRDEPLHDNEALDLVTRQKLKAPSVSSVDLPRGNPHIVEKTWARKIESYTGSAAWKIPEMHEETWVTKSTSKTVAGSLSETVECSGEMYSSTTSDTINELTHARATASTTTVGAMAETTVAGGIVSTTTATTIVDVTLAAAAIAEVTAVPVHASAEASALLFELFTGGHVSVELGGLLDVFVGHKREINVYAFTRVTPQVKDYNLDHIEAGLKAKKIALQQNWTALKTSVSSAMVSLGEAMAEAADAVPMAGFPMI